MSRSFSYALLLPALLAIAAAFFPARLHAQSQEDQQAYPYGDYSSLLGGGEEEEKKPKVWQYSNKYKSKTRNSGVASGLLPEGQYHMYFVRTADTKSNEAVLRIVTPVSLNGCARVLPPKISARRDGARMSLKIENPAVILDKSARYAHYQCPQSANSTSADITLNRDELIENNIKTLTFQSLGGTSDSYILDVTDTELRLEPKTSFAFKPFLGSGKADPLSYNFYPDNMVVLHAPAAPESEDLGDKIAALARSKGLRPVSSPGHSSKNGESFYFIDDPGTLAGSLTFDSSTRIGTVKGEETFQGADGPYQREKQVDVYAKRPGLLD